MLAAGKLRDRIRFERPTFTVDPRFGGGQAGWAEVCTVYAEVLDVLPGKAESAPQGVEIALRPARIRIRARQGLSSDMRVVVLGQYPRALHIVSGPALIEGGAGMELVAQEISSNG